MNEETSWLLKNRRIKESEMDKAKKYDDKSERHSIYPEYKLEGDQSLYATGTNAVKPRGFVVQVGDDAFTLSNANRFHVDSVGALHIYESSRQVGLFKFWDSIIEKPA